MSIESVAASTVTTDALVEAWNAAYAGYFVDVSRDAAGLQAHVETGSIDLGRSVVLRDGGRPIALSLLGARSVETSDAAAGSVAGSVASASPRPTAGTASRGASSTSSSTSRGGRGWRSSTSRC